MSRATDLFFFFFGLTILYKNWTESLKLDRSHSIVTISIFFHDSSQKRKKEIRDWHRMDRLQENNSRREAGDTHRTPYPAGNHRSRREVHIAARDHHRRR